MEKYLKNIADSALPRRCAIALTVSLLGLIVSSKEARGGALFVGRYGYFSQDINQVSFIPATKSTSKLATQTTNNTSQNQTKQSGSGKPKQTSLEEIQQQLGIAPSSNGGSVSGKTKQQISPELARQLLSNEQFISDSLQQQSSANSSQLNGQVPRAYQTFVNSSNGSNFTSQQSSVLSEQELNGIANPDVINQNINGRYQGLVENKNDQMNMLVARQLLVNSSNQLGREFNSGVEGASGGTNPQEAIAMLQSQGLLDALPQQQKKTINFPKPLLAAILLLIGWRGYYLLRPWFKAFGESVDQGIVEGLKDKYGNPKVPNSAELLHNRTFKELSSLAGKAERIASEKFGSEEFMLYARLKQQVEQGVKEYKNINLNIQYLEVAVATQSSFLRLEEIELRYRSRKQQEFYSFVVDTISDDMDKESFRNAIKRKLAEIVPLLHTEEGRNALQSYIKEVNKISKHDLGLKLFSLFKKYQFADFTILKKVSDIIKHLEGQELLSHDSLIVLVVDNYDVLENLAPIIGIPDDNISPETFAKILQYMGLVHRHEIALNDFERLIKILRQWEKPFKSLITIREQYSEEKYRLPDQFKKNIPGISVYKKYEKHLDNC